MTPLVLYVSTNRPGLSDGDEFARQAGKFRELHQVPRAHVIDLAGPTGEERRKIVEAWLARQAGQGADAVAVVMHGSQVWLQTAHKHASGAERLARAIAKGTDSRDVTVVLYACLAGTTGKEKINTDLDQVEGSFAWHLARELEAAGKVPRVLAHTAEGHTTWCPYVVEIRPGSVGWVVAPSSPLWRSWVRQLRNDELWARYPWMSRDELEAVLGGLPGTDPGGGGADVDEDLEDEGELHHVDEDRDEDPELIHQVDEDLEEGGAGGVEVPPRPFPDGSGCGCCCGGRRRAGVCPLADGEEG